MKKFLLSLGVLMVSGAAITVGLASSYSYHLTQYPYYNQYYPNLRTYRPVSNRLAPWQYRSQGANKVTCHRGEPCYDVAMQSGKNALARQAQPYRAGNYRAAIDAYKRSRASQNPRYPNTYQGKRLYVRKGDYVETGVSYLGHDDDENNSNLTVGEDSDFDLKVGKFNQDASGVYRMRDSSLAFRISKTPSAYKCAQSNFWSCAMNLNKQFRDTQKLGAIFNLNNEFRWNQTNDMDFDYYPTVTETFDTLNGSKRHTYFVFNALNPNDGTITRIEGVTNTVNSDSSAKEMYRITETFRFKN